MISSLALIGTRPVEALGTVTHYSLSFIQISSTVALSNNLIVKAVDSTDTQVTSYNGVVTLTCSDPNAILPTNTTLPINGGIGGGVTIYFGTAGTQTVTVTDTIDNTIVGTLTVTVAPIHFSVSITPTNIIAGESVNVTVTALDASDNVLTTIGDSGYGASIDFSSSDSQAVFPLQGSPSNMINGIGIFNITLNTVGSQTITVVNKGFPLVNATTTAITVNTNETAIPTASPSPTSTASPTPTVTPTSTPTAAPTVTPKPQTTDNSNNTLVIIAIVIVVVALAAIVAVLFLRKNRSSTSDLPPPPPPPT
jgi:hypothetical protein